MKTMGVRMKMAKIMRKNHAALEVRNPFTILTSVRDLFAFRDLHL